MKPSTIHGIHSILSGAFEAAQRWEWVDFNPAESAKPPDWVTHCVCDLAKAAGVDLDIKGIRHHTVSQFLAAGVDLGNTAARFGHSGGGATMLKHYADPVSEVDRRAAPTSHS